jgi:tetratricopeptide (TPR) repeat protein
MSQADWFDRLSQSIRTHETERRETFTSIGRYRLMEELGRGGMGVVYHAFDPQLGREVALKVLLDQGFASAEARERFMREAHVAARLSHPNIIPVFDTGEHEGKVYLAMQFIEGAALDRAKLGPREAVSAVRDAARAVHAAHEEGIVHRDLKPANLMVDRAGRVYVTDFGLARRVESGASLTLSGTVVGTPAYMPPEQATGKATDARSDVYALGATLYEVLTGKPPFSGATPLETLKAVTLDEPVPPRRHNAEISKGLEAVVLKAMDKKPEGRYPTAAAFADDLDRWLRGEEVHAPVRGTVYRLRKKVVRHRWRVISGALAVALAGAILVIIALYLRALQAYREGLRENDPVRKREFFEAAASWIPEARRALAEMIEMERKAQQKLADERATDIDRQRSQADRISASLRAFKDHVKGHRVREARRLLDELRAHAPDQVESLQILLRTAEFDEGLKELEALAEGSKRTPFEEKFKELEGDDYKDQTERDRRLGAVALKMGLALMGKSPDAEPAIPWLDRAADLKQDSWKLFEARSLAHTLLEHWDAAERDYAAFRNNCPGDTPPRAGFSRLMIHRAEAATKGGRHSDALEHLQSAARINPKDVSALHLSGLARSRAGGSPAEALNDLNRALNLDPELRVHPDYVGICVTYVQKVIADEALREDHQARETGWSAALQRTRQILARTGGDSPVLLLWQARLRRRLRDYPGAFEDAKRAGGGSEALLLRGQVLFAMGTPEALREARILLDEAVRVDPSSGACLYWRTRCATDPSSEKDLKAALVSEFSSADLLHQLARLQLARGDASSAVQTSTLAISHKDPNPEDAISILGERDRKSPTQARHSLTPELFYLRSRARFRLREFAACREDCRLALDLAPGHRDARFQRGYASYLLKDFSAAIDDFNEVLRADLNDAETHVARGTAYRDSNQLDRALEDYARAIELNPRYPEAFVGRAGAKLLKGDRKGAKEDFQRALDCAPKDWPDRQEVEEALRK